jgi:Fe2+ or Zn2+ uptake regulation protein
MNETWRLKPLRTAIMEILFTKGALTFDELKRELRKENGFEEVTDLELLNNLMYMEVEGLVKVTTFARGSKRIEPAEVRE